MPFQVPKEEHDIRVFLSAIEWAGLDFKSHKRKKVCQILVSLRDKPKKRIKFNILSRLGELAGQ